METKAIKPLGHRAYGSIGHIRGSRVGTGDHMVPDGQAEIATKRVRDKHDFVLCQEKLDGSNVCVAKQCGILLPLIRSGYHARDSRYSMHHKFDAWVWKNQSRFDSLLRDGERVSGEWLIQAHGTRYDLPHEPFVAFDIFTDHTTRLPYADFLSRIVDQSFTPPRLIHMGTAFPLSKALVAIETSGHGAIDPVEGVVWRVERHGRVDFLCKYVRPSKVDGCYLGEEVMNTWKEPA